MFSNKDLSDEIVSITFKLNNTANWNINKARKIMFDKGIDNNNFIEYCYHSFDYRWTYYNENIITRMRKPIMGNMLNKNLALLTMRQVKG